MRGRSLPVWSLLLLAAAGCAGATSHSLQLTMATLRGSDGIVRRVIGTTPARFTVLEFFSAGCDGQAAHDARLLDLYRSYHALGVDFYAIDSEIDATASRDAAEARRRRYPYPILLDPGARLAEAVGAEYATYTVIVDAAGRIVYRGSIDSDDAMLRDDATHYVGDALADLLAGRPLRRAEGRTLGCALRVW